jgi:prepilin peptidase CpaA
MEMFALIVVALALFAAALSDLRRFIIPNWASLGIVAAYAAVAVAQPLNTSLAGLAIGVAVFAGGAMLFAAGWLGGGDVKLLGSLALWAGPSGIADLLANTAFAGAGLAAVLLVRLRLRTPGDWRLQQPMQAPMPFGVAIAIGGWALIISRWPVT